jgi:hypothetical protein
MPAAFAACMPGPLTLEEGENYEGGPDCYWEMLEFNPATCPPGAYWPLFGATIAWDGSQWIIAIAGTYQDAPNNWYSGWTGPCGSGPCPSPGTYTLSIDPTVESNVSGSITITLS